uniref:C2H2-type domain-containing protein n=1 Tax=Meloidogyne enterolobii TaxID=390850 RepID=A0A6V7X953_MELEN|nr:unnamed protein product [Meloidogyne enterolobii]
MASTSNNSRNCPKYAVVHLPEGTNVLNFYQLLLSNGFSEVSFVNEIRENAFLPSIMGGNSGSLTSTGHKNDLANINIIPTNETTNPTIEKVVDSVAKISNPTFTISSSPIPQITINNGQQQQQKEKTLKDIALIKMFGERNLLNENQQQNILIKTKNNNNIQTICGIKKNNILPIINDNNTNSVDFYSVCALCKSRLLSTRLSNLVNHVRRHATIKQYRCKVCNYEHIEMGKVRLHMLKAHKDSSSPVDRLNFEMQIEWGMLMEKCFPEHAKRFGLTSTATNSPRNLENIQKFIDVNTNYTCTVCGELVIGSQLINHIEDIHNSECIDFICGECGYENESKNNLIFHINSQHKEKATKVILEQKKSTRNFVHFLKKFFANVNIPNREEGNLNNSKYLLEPQEIGEGKEKEIKLEGELINLSEDEEELKLELEDNFDNYLEGGEGEEGEVEEEGKRKEENNNLNILECCSNLILNEQNNEKILPNEIKEEKMDEEEEIIMTHSHPLKNKEKNNKIILLYVKVTEFY